MVKESEENPDVQCLSAKQIHAISLLAGGKSKNHVATTVGISPKTISSWVNHSEQFARVLEREKLELLQKTRDQIVCAAVSAVSELQSILHGGSSDSVRLKAAMYILDRAVFEQGNGSEVRTLLLPKSLVSDIARRVDSELKEIVDDYQF